MATIATTTQQHLPIEDVIEDVVILKNGSAVSVIQTTAVNFELLSEPEQDAMINAYGQLLNSLSFPIQIIIRSRKVDISSYLQSLEKAEQDQLNPSLKAQIAKYRVYVTDLISKNEVLDKDFYVIIPFFHPGTGMTGKGGPFGGMSGLFGVKKAEPKFILDKRAVFEKAKTQLEPKREHIIKQLTRIGVQGEVLNTEQLIELFYDIFNPDIARKQKLQNEGTDHRAYLVEAAVVEEPA